MNPAKGRKIALDLMSKYGLDNWRFEYRKAVGYFGICYVSNRTIAISSVFLEAMAENEFTEIVLHEIAHALTPGQNHNWKWKQKCRELGIKPEVCQPPDAKWIEARSSHIKYRLVCEVHGVRSEFFRRPRAIRSCSSCSPMFSKDHILKVVSV